MAGIALLDRRHVLIQDEIEANRSVELIWNFHTRAQIEIHGGHALLSSDSSRIELQIVAPRGARFETIIANPPPPQGQQPDVTNLIIRLPGTRNTRLAVGITRASNEVVPSLGPLSQWVSGATAQAVIATASSAGERRLLARPGAQQGVSFFLRCEP